MLYSGSKGAGYTSDPYKTAVIDAIVAEVQSTPGEDRCVLLLGYKKEMEEMLENSNPGLARRFQPSYAFQYTPDSIHQFWASKQELSDMTKYVDK